MPDTVCGTTCSALPAPEPTLPVHRAVTYTLRRARLLVCNSQHRLCFRIRSSDGIDACHASPTQACRRRIVTIFMTTTLEKTFPVGKFLVSPLARFTEAGDYAASLSIRSGRGTGTRDRVFRFVPRFSSRQDALHYAMTQSLGLLPTQHA